MNYRVLRSGSWEDELFYQRVSYRYLDYTGLHCFKVGFRVIINKKEV